MSSMRSKTSKTFAWIIVVILVIGLAGFGIQDVLRSSGRNEVASFGNQKISSDDYVRMIQQEIRNVSQQLGTNLTFSQARTFGVTQTALQKLISSAILDQTMEDLGISQSNSNLEKSIKNNSAFTDIAGRFSVEKYQNTLLNVNLQPNEYEEILRKELSRNLLLKLTADNLSFDKNIEKLIASYFLEERVADVIILKKKDIKNLNITVTDLEAKSFYDSYNELFTQSETKKISFIYLTAEDLLEKQIVSKQEIKDAYELEKQAFNIPEKRNIDQIFFDDEDTAKSALFSKPTKLLSFENIIEERNLQKDDVSLGEITIAELSLEAGNQLFSVSKNSVVGPIKTDLGFALYRVNEIMPAVVKSLTEEFDNIKKTISLAKAEEELSEIIEFANDEMAGGLSLEEVAKSTGMTFGKLDIHAEANLPEFTKSISFKEMLKSAKNYASDVQFDESGGIFSIRLDGIVDPFVKDFNSVKDLAKQKLLSKKLIKALEEKAHLLIENHKDGNSSLLKTAKNELYELIEDKKYVRFERLERLPQEFTETLFSLNQDDSTVILGTEEVFIIQLKEIISGSIDSEDGKQLRKQIGSQFSNSLEQDIFSALIDGLKETHNLFISQKAVDASIARFN